MHEVERTVRERQCLPRRPREPQAGPGPEGADRDRIAVGVDPHHARAGGRRGDVEAARAAADVQHAAAERAGPEQGLQTLHAPAFQGLLGPAQADEHAPVGDTQGVAVVGGVVAIGELVELGSLALEWFDHVSAYFKRARKPTTRARWSGVIPTEHGSERPRAWRSSATSTR